jgi:long-chain acyl-CoA synthetase
MGKNQSIAVQNYSVAKEYLPDPGFSPVFVSPVEFSGVPALENGCRTLYESLIRSVRNFPNNPFLGTRQYDSSGVLGGYTWKTYSEIFFTCQKLVSALQKWNILGKSSNLFVIMSKNREEMVVSELSCLLQNIPVVPLADNLSSENLSEIFLEVKPSVLFCGKAQCDMIMSLPENYLLSLKTVILFDTLRDPIKAHMRSLGIEIFEYQEIFKMQLQPVQDSPPTSESLAMIMYTSGTSGTPKGVMLLHRNLISSFIFTTKASCCFYETDSYLMYLPHSHIYDRFMFYSIMNAAGKIGFYSGDMLNIKEDMMLLKPTIFISVPRILNRFYEIIKKRFQEKKGLSAKIVSSALESKLRKYETTGNLKNSFLEKVAFKKCRKSVGGRVRLMISASAPLSGNVLKFLRLVFACPIIESLGITETSAPCFITQDNDIETGHIGGPLPGVEAKLRLLEDCNFQSNSSNLIGELYVRSSSLFVGYYKGQEITDKVVDSDGWYNTGDICERNSRTGSFKVISRMSSIVKLSQGEFVSLEKVEKILLQSLFVSQIFVYGDGFHHFLVAVVVPSKDFVLKSWVISKSFRNRSDEYFDIINRQKFKSDLLEDLKDVGFRNNLTRTEMICDVFIEGQEWTDCNLLTITQKLNRLKAREKYQREISRMFEMAGK